MKYIMIGKLLLSSLLFFTLFMPISSCASCKDKNGETIWDYTDKGYEYHRNGDIVTYSKIGKPTISCTMITEYTYPYKYIPGIFNDIKSELSNLFYLISIILILPVTILQIVTRKTWLNWCLWLLQMVIPIYMGYRVFEITLLNTSEVGAEITMTSAILLIILCVIEKMIILGQKIKSKKRFKI